MQALRCRKRVAAWARRRQGDDQLPVTLHTPARLHPADARRPRLRVLLLVMLVAGLNYANSLALLLTFLLAGFALVAMHQCHRNLVARCCSAAPRRCRPSRDTAARCASRCRTTPSSMRYRHRDRRRRTASRRAAASSPRAAGRRSTLPSPRRKRGIVRIDALQLSTTLPFGLFRAWTWVHMPHRDDRVSAAARRAAHARGQRAAKSGERSRAHCRHRRMARPAPFPRRRFAAAGRLEGVRARRAAAREGIQRDGRRAAPVRFLASSSTWRRSAPRAARALGRGRGNARRALRR